MKNDKTILKKVSIKDPTTKKLKNISIINELGANNTKERQETIKRLMAEQPANPAFKRFTKQQYDLMRKTAKRYGVTILSKYELANLTLSNTQHNAILKRQLQLREQMSTPSKIVPNISLYDADRRHSYKESLIKMMKREMISEDLRAVIANIKLDIDLATYFKDFNTSYAEAFIGSKSKPKKVSFIQEDDIKERRRYGRSSIKDKDVLQAFMTIEGTIIDTINTLEFEYGIDNLYKSDKVIQHRKIISAFQSKTNMYEDVTYDMLVMATGNKLVTEKKGNN